MNMILSLTRRCVEDFLMIQPGDRVAVGVSGGKDSLVLLMALAKLREFYPIPFTVEAFTLDMGHSDGRDSQCARAFARSVEHDDALGVGVPDVEIVHFGVVDIEHGFDCRLVVPLEIGRGQIEGVGVGRLVVLGVVADQERLAGLDQDVVAVARNAENLVDDAVIRPGIFALVERDVLDGGDLRRRDNQQPVGVEILVGVVADLLMYWSP